MAQSEQSLAFPLRQLKEALSNPQSIILTSNSQGTLTTGHEPERTEPRCEPEKKHSGMALSESEQITISGLIKGAHVESHSTNRSLGKIENNEPLFQDHPPTSQSRISTLLQSPTDERLRKATHNKNSQTNNHQNREEVLNRRYQAFSPSPHRVVGFSDTLLSMDLHKDGFTEYTYDDHGIRYAKTILLKLVASARRNPSASFVT